MIKHITENGVLWSEVLVNEPMIWTRCTNCKVMFQAKRGNYCSEKCRAEAFSKWPSRQPEAKRTWGRKNYRQKHPPKDLPEKTCPQCGEMFKPKRAGKKYCSTSCQMLLNQRRRNNFKGCFELSDVERYQKRKLSDIRRRALRAGIPFDIGVDDIPIPDVCPVFRVPLNLEGGGTGNVWAPSVDRLIPKLGYVPGNVRVVSQRANMMKSDYTLEELEMLVNWLRSELHR